MKITNIETIPIFPKLAARYESEKVRLHGIDHRIVYKVETDKGVTGFGDLRIRPGKAPDPSTVEHLIGQNPFHYLNNTFNGGLGAALYDVMGKYLEVPAYRLMGQRCGMLLRLPPGHDRPHPRHSARRSFVPAMTDTESSRCTRAHIMT